MRLIPSGIVVISIFLTIKILLVPIDVQYLLDQIFPSCKNAWWAMVIFVQNYYDDKHMVSSYNQIDSCMSVITQILVNNDF